MTFNVRSALLLAITLHLGSCATKPKAQAPQPSPTASPVIKGQTLMGSQGIVQLIRPEGWTNQLTEEDALNLKMTNVSQDAYLTLQTRAKRDLPQFSLEKFAKVGRQAGLQTLTDLKITGPTDVTLVNGYPAIQYRFQGKVEGIDTVLLHTAIESPNHLHQILAGASRFSFQQHQSTFQKIIQTFQERPESDAAPPK